MAPKGGVRKRLAASDPADVERGDEGDKGSGRRRRVVGIGGEGAGAGQAEPEERVNRGGVRQRLVADGIGQNSSSSSSGGHLPLFSALRRDWALGKITSKQVQQYAEGASDQGSVGMDALARAGAGGKHPGNLFRSLVAAFGLPPGAPDLFWVDIPIQGEATPMPHPFILPHAVFQSLFKHRRLWEKVIQGQIDSAYEFWQNSPDVVRLHGCLERGKLTKTVPIGVHGDAGAFSSQESVLTISWNSLLAVQTEVTLAKRFLFTTIKSSALKPDGSTLAAIWRVFAWSMNTLLSGDMPSHDWQGRPLYRDPEPIADGWRAALVQCRGDWIFFNEAIHAPRHNESENMCWLCSASNAFPQTLWTNFSATAGWRDSRRDHQKFCTMLEAKGKPMPEVFRVRGFKMEFVMIDILHTVDLGVASHVVANIFLEVMRLGCWGATHKVQLEGLTKDMQEWYKAQKNISRLQGRLTIERLRTTGGWPKLKAKAAATRHLTRYALVLAQRHDSGSVHDRQRLAVAQLLVSFYDVLDQNGMFLSPTAKEALPKIGSRLCIIYEKLSRESLEAGRMMWKLVPKFHLFLHLCEWQSQSFGNPRFWWCYADEDLVGHVVEVASSVHPRSMPAMSLYKWVTFFFNELGAQE